MSFLPYNPHATPEEEKLKNKTSFIFCMSHYRKLYLGLTTIIRNKMVRFLVLSLCRNSSEINIYEKSF